MNFYKELLPLNEYLISIRKLEDYLSIDLKFPMNWGVPKTMTESDGIVPFESKDPAYKGISFVCKMTEEEVTQTMNKISKLVKLNKDREMKEKLFKETIDSLKKTFETTDLETLKRLYFDFDTIKNIDQNEQLGGTTLELVEERTEERPKRVRSRKTEID